MRFLHLADLHLGKNLNGYNLIEDQKYALNQIYKLIKSEGLKYVLIAGDIYQNIIPLSDAMNLFDDFISKCNNLGVNVIIISGNHDSSVRLSFASTLLKKANIYISKAYEGDIEKISFNDEYGRINFYLFPYVKPHDVKPYFKDKEINTYSDAVRTVLDNIKLNEEERNVILSHQFILKAEISESEEIYAGVDESVSDTFYDKFDYIALGHIHKKQSFLNGKLRYPGALLKYSKSESNYEKTILIVEMKEKGNISYDERKIEYLHEMRVIKDFYDNIIKKSKDDLNREDYIHIELLDKEERYEAHQILRKIYPNIMTLRYPNIGTETFEFYDNDEKYIEMKPIELFEMFYKNVKGIDLDIEKKDLMEKSIEEIWGNNENN